MIVSWNVRGINNSGKCIEIISCLNCMKFVLVILVETRVKPLKVQNIRNKTGHGWKFVANYSHHNNG